jgi:hypothetical protein
MLNTNRRYGSVLRASPVHRLHSFDCEERVFVLLQGFHFVLGRETVFAILVHGQAATIETNLKKNVPAFFELRDGSENPSAVRTGQTFHAESLATSRLLGHRPELSFERRCGGGFSEPRSRGFPRSGVGPSLTTGSAENELVRKPRSRGFSVFGLSRAGLVG